jgi:hypothetical protein
MTKENRVLKELWRKREVYFANGRKEKIDSISGKKKDSLYAESEYLRNKLKISAYFLYQK